MKRESKIFSYREIQTKKINRRSERNERDHIKRAKTTFFFFFKIVVKTRINGL